MSASSWKSAAILCACVAAWWVAPAVSAVPMIYHCPVPGPGCAPGRDSIPTSPPGHAVYDELVQPDGSSVGTLDLWIANTGLATDTGTICEDGNGDEICAFEIVLDATTTSGNPVTLQNFVADNSAGYTILYDFDAPTNATQLRIVGRNADDSAPGAILGPVRVGSVDYTGGGNCMNPLFQIYDPDGQGLSTPCAKISVSSGDFVDGGQSLNSIAPDNVPLLFVPEPGVGLRLVTGTLFLLALQRLRRWR